MPKILDILEILFSKMFTIANFCGQECEKQVLEFKI